MRNEKYTFITYSFSYSPNIIFIPLLFVLIGQRTTHSVTTEQILYHTKAVVRAKTSALIISDMPFESTLSAEKAFSAAGRFISEGGAQMVKIEGERCDNVMREIKKLFLSSTFKF